MRRAVATAAALLAAAGAIGGCGQQLEEINRGGRVSGTTLNVYSLLPEPGAGAGRDMVDAEKLALYDARGTAGPFAINFLSIDEGPAGGRDGARESAPAMREALADPQVIAVIGPEGSDTARATVPLLNAAGHPRGRAGRGLPGLHRARSAPASPSAGSRRAASRSRASPATTPTRGGRSCAPPRAATGRDAPRLLVEQEPGPAADALVDAMRDAGAELVEDAGRADAVVYAGDDPENAAAVADDVAREHRGTPIVLPGRADPRRDRGAPRTGRAPRRRARLRSLPSPAPRPSCAASRPPSRSASAARPAPTPRSATRRCAPCWPRSPPPATAPAGARR